MLRDQRVAVGRDVAPVGDERRARLWRSDGHPARPHTVAKGDRVGPGREHLVFLDPVLVRLEQVRSEADWIVAIRHRLAVTVERAHRHPESNAAVPVHAPASD